MRESSVLILAIIILFSCSPILRQDSIDRATFNYQSSEIKQNPALYMGNLFVFGGIIVNTTTVEGGYLIEALYVPVNSRGYLKSVENTGDRFLAIYPKKYDFLDPMSFRKGREITIAGKIIALDTGEINKMDYIFPVFLIEEVHLWKETSEKDFYTSNSYHTLFRSEDRGIYFNELSGHVQDEGKKSFNGDSEVQTDISSIQESTKSVEMKAAEPAVTQEITGKNKMTEDQIDTTNRTQVLTKSEGQDVDRKESSVTAADMFIEKPEMQELPSSEKQAVTEEKVLELPKEEKETDKKKEVVQVKKSFNGSYYVQVGAWKNRDLADKMFNKVREEYHEAHIIIVNDLHKVRILGVKTKEEGIKISQDIEKKYNIKPILVRNP
jgi:outer membrane lipoprotein